MGRLVAIIILVIIAIGAVAWAFGLVNLRQTQDAQLPDVQVDGGQMPGFDADVADVEVGTRNETVKVPTLDVDKPAR